MKTYKISVEFTDQLAENPEVLVSEIERDLDSDLISFEGVFCENGEEHKKVFLKLKQNLL